MDAMMVQKNEALWHKGDSKSLASYTLAGVQHFLMKRQLCPSAWLLMTAWKRAELLCACKTSALQTLARLA
eukprot:3996027-Amphidinium_carterae.1